MITQSEPIQTRAELLVEQWVRQAHSVDMQQRRQHRRYPFFRTVDINGGDGVQFEAFSRDISPSGIGLLHHEPVTPGEELMLTIRLHRRAVEVPARFAWCRPCAPGWHVSGATFCDLGLSKGTPLLIETIGHELERRWRQRFPIFRKIGVSAPGLSMKEEERLHTFTLDVSLTGMAILARNPIPIGPIVIQTEDADGETVDLPADTTWCEERGQGWHVAGCHFQS